MQKLSFFLALCLISYVSANGQYISSISIPDKTQPLVTDMNDPSVKAASSITAAELEEILTEIAGDDYEGRETGHPGIQKAADYISNYYDNLGTTKIGYKNSHMQPVSFVWTSWKETNMIVNKERYRHLWDYLAFPNRNEAMPPIMTDKILFLGYGISDDKYNDYAKAEVKDQVIMIYDGVPTNSEGANWVDPDRWTRDAKLRVAKDKGAKLVLIVTPDIKEMLSKNRSQLLGPSMTLGQPERKEQKEANHVYISSNVAQSIWQDQEEKIIKTRDQGRSTGQPKPYTIKTIFSIVNNKKTTSLEGNNILGFIEGSDKKDEIVVVSAHYDHIGKKGDEVYNGADDNASGTSTVMEIAEAFVEAKKAGNGPRRSILCLHFTGEEKGLLGSNYYVNNPVLPLENTVVDVNVDMVGRVDKNYTDNPDYIYVIGSDRLSTDLHRINEANNKKYSGLTLDYTYNSENDPNNFYGRSDHFNFAKNGIPAIFYFNGVHEDYHMITDTAEKILFDKMENVARLIFHTLWDLANREDRITVDKLP